MVKSKLTLQGRGYEPQKYIWLTEPTKYIHNSTSI